MIKTSINIMIIINLVFLTACAGIRSHSDYLTASKLYQKENFVSSYFYAKKAFDLSPDNIHHASLLAWSSLKLGRTLEAKHILSAIENKEPDNIKIIQAKAWVEYTLGDTDAAIEWFQKELDWAAKQTKKKKLLYTQSIQSDAYYGMGLINTQKKQYEQSRHFYQQALLYNNQFVGHRPITIAYADTFYQSGAYEKAIQHYQSILQESDHGIDLKIAWCLYYLKKYTDAEMYLLKNLYITEDKRPYLYALIFSTFMQGKQQQAKKYLEELIDLDPSVADTNYIWEIIESTDTWQTIPFQMASQYYEKGNFSKASHIVKNILDKDPSQCHARQIEIFCELYQSRALIALSQFNQLAVNTSCDTLQGALGQGLALLYLGYYQDARTFFQKIPETSPHYFRSQMAIGGIEFLTGNIDEALSIYTRHKKELLKKKDHFWPYLTLNTLGWCYVYADDCKQAENIFAQLNDASNDLSGIHLFGLAWAKYQQGKIDDAVSVLLENPVVPYDYFKQSMLLANAFYLKGDYQNAITIYEENMSNFSEKELFFSWGSFALQNLGWCYIHTGQYQKALTIFLKLKNYHPSPIYFATYANLGWGYFYAGMLDESETTFTSAVQIFPDNPMVRNGLKKVRTYRRSKK
ncbi:MAG: tetratricopeptide repeat protein [Candidatus Magnetomorum sp.]|nr:tetratricopeptide repeat protein [Candidatus Magnetomorum sp.]